MAETAEKRNYEGIVILHPDLTVEAQKDFLKKCKGIIESFSGTIHTVETWGKRNLANPIGKVKRATYFHIYFESTTQCVSELERTMRINEKVLRFMHSRLDSRKTLAQHVEIFKKGLLETSGREKEREAKIAARKAAAQAAAQSGQL
ncbi:MAG: 30S ribosomal protein S6 [Pseudobdellovibrionaceae bacterium]